MDNPINIAIVASIGVISTGFLALIWRTFLIIKKRLDMVPDIVAALSVVSKTVAAHTSSNRFSIRAIRYMAESMQENGFNGALKHAFVNINCSEDAINETQAEAVEAAMAVEECG